MIMISLTSLITHLLLVGTLNAMNTLSIENHSNDQSVKVGIRVVPPFVIQEPDGSYSGITITLWEHIATELDISYHFVETDIQGLLDGVMRKSSPPENVNSQENIQESDTLKDEMESRLFAAASALTITSEREETVDFTHPFFITGFGIAVSYKNVGFIQSVKMALSSDFLWVVFLLLALLLILGMLIWIFERRLNEEEFGGSVSRGIGSGFWWAAVTMTTVGYGDKTPKTFWGRVVGFVWMFAGIILISFFTASIASSLTVTQLDHRVSGFEDLPFVRVGALEQSATIDYLENQHIRHRTYNDISSGLRAVANNQIDAFVHDAPILRYYATLDYRNQVQVLPDTFNEQYYGIALPPESPYRNEINRVLLDFIASSEWEDLNQRYLGN
ncbi:MAG: transporter substrate-binding domain-containing protein [Balneolales bacterium]